MMKKYEPKSPHIYIMEHLATVQRIKKNEVFLLKATSLPSEVELVGRVGELLKLPQGLDVFPHFNHVLQQRPVFLLLAVPQLPSVPATVEPRQKQKAGLASFLLRDPR